ncbi:DUF4145 domain-containing protein [Eubacterium barkeri]|uniref:DUF4145 domain-containing protein n=1 Tax=Eubacterium barkeri TaxID=1528 RepID=A0A1H3BGY7_EUBBA|nr:DUF4145 domain-containing protein [Eubacterium barkeri]SDX40988.1 protein of unknown function [Eubacterium barkeri]
MNKTRTISFISGNTEYFKGPIPNICPHCGTVITADLINCVPIKTGITPSFYASIASGRCCDKPFLMTHSVKKGEAGQLLYVWPTFKGIQLPDSIAELSPRFCELYKQSAHAEELGHLDLAGSGYRNALEVLIKDFAIKELGKDESDVVNQNLNRSISQYLPNITLSTSADVVRVLGNDHTHYERHYESIDFDVLKRYLKIFIQSIENEYLIRHPIVPVRQQTNS